MIATTTEIRVRYAETDAMGIAYHGSYITWLEVGRVRMLDEVGLPYRELESTGYRLPVLEVHAQYFQPARFDDLVSIKSIMNQMPTVRMRIDYELHCADRLLCTGYSLHAFVDNAGAPTKPPKHLLEKLREHFS